ncbi:glycosyl hydrolase [Gaopeijia maritima]|uniref:glycosyl hydrolase n=1 Tax=Gaopeijia maritima TaxID=3119007 RepID=UPI003248D6BA
MLARVLPAALRTTIVPAAAVALCAATTAALAPAPLAAQPAPESAFAGLTFRSLGPALMGGRISDLAVVESSPQNFYLGTASGGLWKTENHGTSWIPLFDEQPNASIGDVTIHQANPNLVWVGTGEPQNRQSSPYGNGVYKSTDGGRTWTHMGLDDTRHIGRIVIHPTRPDIVWVAALGHLWGPNEERGVFRTTDGGATWEKVLYIDEHTGAVDLAIDPGDPNTLFAAMYQRQRTGWGFNGGGPGSGIHRTVDGGDSWTELTEGLPEGIKGRIGLDVFRQDGNRVYAIVESAENGGVFRSLDRGDHWEKMSSMNPRPMYYSQIRIDPSNADRVYVLGTQLAVSDDGGRTFRNDGATQIHVDHHALWINPNDPDHLIIGSDGGISASWDGTEHWRMFDNLALGQFYQVSYDMRTPYFVCGGLQDNNPWCGPSNNLSFHGIRHQDWYEVAYGDGFTTLVDPTDSTIVFSETQGGNLNRYDVITGEKTALKPIVGPRAEGDSTKAYRFNWHTPLVMSSHDPSTIYLGSQYLLRSRDRGVSWEEASPDLSRAIDRDTLSIMGVVGSERMLSKHDGTSTYGNLVSVAESPLDPDVLYAGTDDGNVQVTRDGGATWTNVIDRIPGVPERTYVSRLVASHHEPGRVYATFDGHRNDDYAPYAFVSEDFGDSWRAISDGLPDESVNVLVEHPRTPGLLFLGNEVGIWFSVDRGDSWTRLKNDLPTVPVDDLQIHPRDNDLIVGTHGRSIYILADVAPFERLTGSVLAEAGHLFPAQTSVMWAQKGDWPFYGATYSAPNPPRGARIRYYLRDGVGGDDAVANGDADANDDADASGAAGPDAGADANADPELVIRDASGAVVRTLDTADQAGVHEVIWDWRHDRPFEPESSGGGGRGGGGAPPGPIVLPGTYTVTLTVGDTESTTPIVIEPDPRRPMSMADRRARQDALMDLHQMAEPLYQANRALARLGEVIDEARALLPDDAPEDVAGEIDAIEAELDALGDGFQQANRNAGVRNAIQVSSTVPTADQLWQIEQLWSEVPGLVARVNALVETRVPALNDRLDELGARPDPGDTVPMPTRGGGEG